MTEERNLVAARVAELSEVLETFKTQGWIYLEAKLSQQLRDISNELDEAEEFEKIRRLQERKKAYRSIVELVSSVKAEYDEATARLETLDIEQQQRDQYGLDS
jgi:hypothetical protein